MDDPDYLFALKLQKQLNEEDSDLEEVSYQVPALPKLIDIKQPVKRSNPRSNLDDEFLNRTQNLVHPEWEKLDPTPNIFAMFTNFDEKFFKGKLKCVSLEWSKRMYSCAGICYYQGNKFGKSITVRLSEPLLKLRPRKDLVETMLHEMIHAYCFVLNIREGNGGHGPNFKKIMNAINRVAGTNITVYHTFYDEVEHYKQFWWRCNGICQNRSPFYGYVKRSSNRAPSAHDQWWSEHQRRCGGTFLKIKGPDLEKKGDSKRRKTTENGDYTTGGNKEKYEDWIFYDEDLQVKLNTINVVEISDSSGCDDGDVELPTPKIRKGLTADERQILIKQEIINETTNLDESDIVLIDDEFDDNLTVATELADTSIIDELFDEDTLLKEFNLQNDVIPTGSRYKHNKNDDIIKCPICQNQMKRSVLNEHLDGCSGITEKILFPAKKVGNSLINTREVKPKRKPRAPRPSSRDLLRNAGYTEEDLVNIVSSENSDDTIGLSDTTSPGNSTTCELDDSFENSRSYRQRNLLKTTRQCPRCGLEFDDDVLIIHIKKCK
ncbi:uncharacterized protein LOC119671514 [Teleopsis dalmanni]|uniref:uncharacterized protein LOC119671514 n=1 Tax=Teleopsis dalmanni TaxID=139649 RepID=UPI0018CFBCCD|nr:uncharacterized protein LOC119671514 [Teleopsis dalmanni]